MSPLYHRYRPGSFEEIIGNQLLVQTLQESLKKADRPHAILLHGPVGCGKTTIGRIIASELGCRGSDFREIDAADFRGIDTIREIRTQSQFQPLEGKTRVWLLDECHQLGSTAQPALLKALENFLPHVYYILATTDPQKLLPTIRSRCAQYQVSPLTDRQMFRLLKRVLRKEKEELDQEVIDQIIMDSQGHPRNALQILDKVLSAPVDQRLSAAQQSAEMQSKTIELCRALINKQGWKQVARILSGLKEEEPESIRRAVLGYCQAILLKGSLNIAAIRIMEQLVPHTYDSGWPGLTYAIASAVLLAGDGP